MYREIREADLGRFWYAKWAPYDSSHPRREQDDSLACNIKNTYMKVIQNGTWKQVWSPLDLSTGGNTSNSNAISNSWAEISQGPPNLLLGFGFEVPPQTPKFMC
jgi:hypothetical protein